MEASEPVVNNFEACDVLKLLFIPAEWSTAFASLE